jgi:hypothetical protein
LAILAWLASCLNRDLISFSLCFRPSASSAAARLSVWVSGPVKDHDCLVICKVGQLHSSAWQLLIFL